MNTYKRYSVLSISISMTEYQILIEDRNYDQWYFIDSIEGNRVCNNELLNNIEPYKQRYFTKDYIKCSDNEVKLVKSDIRNGTNITAVLILSNNKMFGRYGKRQLYQCIPDDQRLPIFLVPYEIKMGFSKDFKNKYVTFKFTEWNDKHPIGHLTNVIGDVDEIFNFFEYQLYCKSLQISINEFNKKTRTVMNNQNYEDLINTIEKEYKIQDHTKKKIFTIDSESTTEYDDALYYEEIDDKIHVYVYISNVFLWLEIMNLWTSFTKRVSTIYLPDRRRPLLPTLLADTLCSLQEKQTRLALTYEFIYSKDKTLVDIKYYNSKIKVRKNQVYESELLRRNAVYLQLLQFTQNNDKTVENSHDVVSHWMIKINQYSSEIFMKNKCGIFRSVSVIDKTKTINCELSKDTSRALSNWNNVIGKYIYYNENEHLVHDLLGEKSYVHISSPIRRLVDLLNQIELMELMNCQVSDEAKEFHKTWVDDLELLNTSMRAIRKVQQECDILYLCFNKPELLDQEYNGVLFDKIQKNDESYSYIVYIEELKMLSKFICYDEYNNYSRLKFKLFMFEKESSYKKKIKLQLISI